MSGGFLIREEQSRNVLERKVLVIKDGWEGRLMVADDLLVGYLTPPSRLRHHEGLN